MIINIHHHFKHIHYVDVLMPPEAMQMIEENVAWLTPSAMASKVQVAHPKVSAAQIHNAWQEHSQTHWCRDILQLPSARKLLVEFRNEVDVFNPIDVPEGVEILAWGLKKIAEPLNGKVLEIGMDTTCEYNLKPMDISLTIKQIIPIPSTLNCTVWWPNTTTLDSHWPTAFFQQQPQLISKSRWRPL